MADFFGTLMTGAISAGQNYLNRNWAAEQAEEDRQRNFYYNDLAAQRADARTRALYQDLYSPGAIKEQLEQAGLSPSIFYGGTPGGGGTAGAMSGGASGPQTQYQPMNVLESAQAAALLAQAEKTKTETQEMKGETAKGWAEIENILADTGSKKTLTTLQSAQAAGQALENYIKENTKDASIYMICEYADKAGYEAEKAFEELKQAKVLTEVNQKTMQEQIEIKKQELKQLQESILNTKALTDLTKMQKLQVSEAISQAWDKLEIEWGKLDVDEQQVDTYTKWINEQIPIIEKQLQVRFKELDIEQSRMIIDAVTGTIKSIAFGAMAAASFKGGQGSLQQPTMPQKAGKFNKMNQYERGLNIERNKNLYGY